MRAALSTTFKDSSTVIDIDDCSEVYGGRSEIDIDDTGEAYEPCPMADAGHLTVPVCGGLRCVHRGMVVAR